MADVSEAPLTREERDEPPDLDAALRSQARRAEEWRERWASATAERDALREAIRDVLTDEETGAGGWGPDVTMANVLRAALEGHVDGDERCTDPTDFAHLMEKHDALREAINVARADLAAGRTEAADATLFDALEGR